MIDSISSNSPTPITQSADPSQQKIQQTTEKTESGLEQRKPDTREASPVETKNNKQIIAQLESRDREVRAHEAAHKTAGGALTGAASYSFQTGPDGNKYAVGGEVSIDTSKIANDPQATLIKASVIRAAALAPMSPSAQDRSIAANSDAMAAQASSEIFAEKQTENKAEGATPSQTDTDSKSDKTSNHNLSSSIALYQAIENNNPKNSRYIDQLI